MPLRSLWSLYYLRKISPKIVIFIIIKIFNLCNEKSSTCARNTEIVSATFTNDLVKRSHTWTWNNRKLNCTFTICLFISFSIQLIRITYQYNGEWTHMYKIYTFTNTIKCMYIVHTTYSEQKKNKCLSIVACCKKFPYLHDSFTLLILSSFTSYNTRFMKIKIFDKFLTYIF